MTHEGESRPRRVVALRGDVGGAGCGGPVQGIGHHRAPREIAGHRWNGDSVARSSGCDDSDGGHVDADCVVGRTVDSNLDVQST